MGGPSAVSKAFGKAVNTLLPSEVGAERAAVVAECARTAFDLDAYSMGMAMTFAQVRSLQLPTSHVARSRSWLPLSQ